MSLINFLKIYNIFKKRYKKFLILNFIFIIFFILANHTIFKEKLSKVYEVTFDYQYINSWTELVKKRMEFNYLLSKVHKQSSNKKDNPFHFHKLEDLYGTFFGLMYQYNIEDIQTNNVESTNFKIASAFNFDTTNFTFKNKKIHVAWNDQKEAIDYLESLHSRSVENIKNTLDYSYNQYETIILSEINNLFRIYPLEDVKKELIVTISRLNKGVNNRTGIDGINGVETNKFLEKKIKQSNFDTMSDAELISLLRKIDSLIINPNSRLKSEKNELLLYYFMSKFDNTENLKNITLLPNLKYLIDEIDQFLPSYYKHIKKVNYILIYLVELLLSVIISLLITFAPQRSKKN